jgi:hypothetical protein
MLARTGRRLQLPGKCKRGTNADRASALHGKQRFEFLEGLDVVRRGR